MENSKMYAALAVVLLILVVAYYAYYKKDDHSLGYAGENYMNTAHWDTSGTYGHTAPTWGIPPHGGLQPDYSGYSKNSFDNRENMMVGAHWTQSGTYGHTPATLPDFDLSGYNEEVPTDAN